MPYHVIAMSAAEWSDRMVGCIILWLRTAIINPKTSVEALKHGDDRRTPDGKGDGVIMIV